MTRGGDVWGSSKKYEITVRKALDVVQAFTRLLSESLFLGVTVPAPECSVHFSPNLQIVVEKIAVSTTLGKTITIVQREERYTTLFKWSTS